MSEQENQQEQQPLVDVATDKVDVLVCSKCGCEIDVSEVEPFSRVECPDCGSIEPVPARLGSFLLLNLIGTGGMGGVYYAKDETLGRFVAIKVMLKSVGENKEFVESFRREAQAIARLNHPNIVQIYSFGQEKGQPYIVMELVSGQRFDKMVETKKALNQSFVMRIGLDVAEGLQAAYEAGLMHGDIKPENILLDEKMRAKLVDFGIATFANQNAQEGIWGTPYYIAPEKIRRQKVDCRSDIYSLGATLYHALAGRPPFEGKTPIEVVKARLVQPALDIKTVRPDIHPEVARIVHRMLESDLALRYPNYNSLISDLRKVVQQLPPPPAVTGYASEINKKTGKVVVTRRKTSSLPIGPSDLPPPQPTRLVVHKRSTPQPLTTEALAEHRKRSLSADARQRRPGRAKKIIAGVFAAMLVLGVAAGIVAAVVHVRAKKKAVIEKRREMLALSGEKKKAADVFGKAMLAATNILKAANMVTGHVDLVKNAVLLVCNEPLQMPAQQIQKVPPAASSNQQTAASSNQPPTQGEVGPQEQAQAKPEEGSGQPAAQAPPMEEPEIVVQARIVVASVEAITSNSAVAAEARTNAIASYNEAVAAGSSDLARAKVAILEEIYTRLQTIEEQVRVLERIPLERMINFLKKVRRWDEYSDAYVRVYLRGTLADWMAGTSDFPSRCPPVIDERDRIFFERMQPFLREGGAAVFLGAPHLWGVNRMLEQDGHQVVQIGGDDG